MLRDDISRLVSRLIKITTDKLNLLEKITLLDRDCFHYLNTGDLERAGKILEKIDFLRNHLDELDFESGTARDALLSIMGIDRLHLENLIKVGNEKEFLTLKRLQEQIRETGEKLGKNREKLIDTLLEMKRKTGAEIGELEKLSHLKIVGIPDNQQGSKGSL